MHVQPTGVGPGFFHVLANALPDALSDMLIPGRVIEAEVVSVFEGRAVLTLGRRVRLEVELQADVKEGQRVKLLVQQQGNAAAESGSRVPFVLRLVSAQTANSSPVRSGNGTELQGQVQDLAHPESKTSLSAPGQNVAWLPIPLPGGLQGWAQLQIREDESRKGSKTGASAYQVRLWWETPAIGPVIVTLDAADAGLTALFTVQASDSRQLVERSLSELQGRLANAGFPEARLGVRKPPSGDVPGPLRTDDTGLFDRRIWFEHTRLLGVRQLAERKRTRDKVAVALGYEARRDHAPRVLAAGRGEIAEAILQAAKRSDVAIHVDHPLANALIKLELGEAIPPELYVAVAEVMAFLWRMECQKSDHGWAEPNTR